jgi:RNA polymerase sigma factor for flagellar operon FliA
MNNDGTPRSSTQTAELIASCQGLVRSIAWKIHRRLPPHVDLEDLVGYGQVGLAESARDYDPAQGTQFTTFAYYRVRVAILDGLSRLNWFNQADYNRGRYEWLAEEVLQPEHQTGRGDRPASQAGKLDEDVRWFKRATGALAVVYLMSHGGGQSGAGTDLESSQRSPVESAISAELSERLREAVEELPGDARTLIQAAYFEGLSLKDAGERIGISKAWASRLHARTLQQLARALSTEVD